MQKIITTIIGSALLTACTGGSDNGAAAGGPDDAAAQSLDLERLSVALSESAGRSAEDKERDAGRKPAEVLSFIGVKPGDTVLDVIAASGWYTEVLSLAVGEKGRVYAQNPKAVLKLRDGANDKALTARLAENRLANVTRLDEDLDALTVPENSIDVAVTALNFHDIYNGLGEEAAQGFLKTIMATLKPGGVFAIVDHVGIADADNQNLHRIEPDLVTAAAKQAGFIVEGQSDILSVDTDDHSKNVFEEDVRGQTDRFLITLKKPDEDK